MVIFTNLNGGVSLRNATKFVGVAKNLCRLRDHIVYVKGILIKANK